MKITIEVSHFAEVRELVATLDRHRVGAVLLLVAVVVVIGTGVVAWNVFR
jgi:uncharacterized protein (DUF488 family)